MVETPEIAAEDVLRRGSPCRDGEILDGVPRVREPSGGWAEEVGSRVVAPLCLHVRERGLGWVFVSRQGFLLSRGPERLLAADGAYVARERLPRLPRRGFVPLAPDFVLEVRSPRETWEMVLAKCGIWVAHGIPVAWAVDPLESRVAELGPAAEPVEVPAGGVADGAPVLSGFRVAVDDLFAGLV